MKFSIQKVESDAYESDLWTLVESFDIHSMEDLNRAHARCIELNEGAEDVESSYEVVEFILVAD